MAALVACAQPAGKAFDSSGTLAAVPRDPTSTEVDCAWFGDTRGDRLFFGVSAFWSAMRQNEQDPSADLAQPGGRYLGEYDLSEGRTRFHPLGTAPSGIWDVLAHPNGRVYFTTFFDSAGILEPDGSVTMLDDAGRGLNELAPGPAGRILASRYATDADGQGAVVVLGEDGRVQAEFPLPNPEGFQTAAKSLAWDPVRGEIWVNTDLIAETPGRPAAHDTRILSAGGQERARFTQPEVQFMTFGADGTGYFAEVADGRLRLRIRPPEAAKAPLGTGRWVLLDEAFPHALDFVQEVRVGRDGEAIVTRWSGKIHIVAASGRVRSLQLPRREGDLYYTGVRAGNRVCATVCRTAPDPAAEPAWVVCAPDPG